MGVHADDDAVRQEIERHGWTLLGLQDGGLTHTVGLTERGWPELVVSMAPAARGAEALFPLVDHWVQQSMEPKAGARFTLTRSDRRMSLGVVLVRYPNPERTLPILDRMYRDRDYTVLEVTPDRSRPPKIL